MSITGECFYGAVKYQSIGSLINARACHCSRCRKAFSGAGSAYAELSNPESFKWISGERELRCYATQGADSDWGLAFCGICGSTLCGTYKDKVHGVTLGTINGDPGVDIGMHIFVGSKAPWDHIGGYAPQFDAFPD